jgi:hypothetical protein
MDTERRGQRERERAVLLPVILVRRDDVRQSPIPALPRAGRRLLDNAATQATVDTRLNTNTDVRNNLQEPATAGKVQIRTTANVKAAEAESADLQQASDSPVSFGDGDFPIVAEAPGSGVQDPVTLPAGESFDAFLERTWSGPGAYLSHALDHHT